MKEQYPNEERETIEALQSLNAVPERPQEQVERGKAAFLSQAKRIAEQPVSISPFQRLINSLTQPQPRLRLSTLTIAVIFATTLLISFSGSVYAARYALPDELLYPYKLWLEDRRLALTRQDDSEIDLHLDYAEERLREYQALKLDSSNPLSGLVLDEFYSHTADVDQLLASSSRTDEQETRLQELQAQLDQLLERELQDQDGEDDEDKDEESLSSPKPTSTPDDDDAFEAEETLKPSATQKPPTKTEKPETEDPEETDESEDIDDSETDEPDDSDTSDGSDDDSSDTESTQETPES